MIKDNIKNIGRYSINEYFEKFKENFRDVNSVPTKLNSPFKAIPLEYETKNFDLTKFENHDRNIDIHYIIEGSELIGLNLVENLKSNMEYDEKGDYQLFDGNFEDYIILKAGEFLLLFPGEAHVTGGINVKSNLIKKVVYKIPY